jgi:DNA gyrase/topoisomerase IV subunit B
MARKYDESSITYYSSDLEKIRAKPHMYIGPTDGDGVFTLAREALDNSVDEARAGRNEYVALYHDQNDFWVVDQGVGIPVKKHPQAKISTLTHVLTALQSSGKIKGDAYESAIGTHGVGIKCTNALSSTFEVWTFRKEDGGWHYTKFERGAEKVKVRSDKAPKLPDGTKPKSGTVIHWLPDATVFNSARLNGDRIPIWAELTAYMNPGLKVVYHDGKRPPKEWFSKNGIKDYIAKRLTKLKAEQVGKKFVDYKSKHLELAFMFTDAEGDNMEFFTNTVRNVDRGFHAQSFQKALHDSLKPYRGKLEFTPSDLQEGLVGVLNLKIDGPKFSSQTKEKMVDERGQKPCYEECLKLLEQFWKENKTFAKEVAQRAAELRKKTADFLKDKKLSRSVKKAKNTLAHKLAGIQGNAPVEDRELYLVEGDSAGGSVKLVRNKKTQAVFPLKGKPLNVMEVKKDKVNANPEIATILAAIGINLESAKGEIGYGKIITMADADRDGLHIATLLAGFFYKFKPDLYKELKIYVLDAPEYVGEMKGGKLVFGESREEVYKKAGKKIPVQHLKGWGEAPPEWLRIIALDPDSRKLIQVTWPESKKGRENFEQMLGKNPLFRKKMLGLA